MFDVWPVGTVEIDFDGYNNSFDRVEDVYKVIIEVMGDGHVFTRKIEFPSEVKMPSS